jgi:hypothetical protein
MARALHLLKGADPALALATIERQLAAGDHVTVVVLADTAAPPLPAAVAVHRVPGEWSYERLLDAVFEADHVVAW